MKLNPDNKYSIQKNNEFFSNIFSNKLPESLDVESPRQPEQKLILQIIFRAFCDSINPSRSLCNNSKKKFREAMHEGLEFINGHTEIYFGTEWYDSTELCILATGSDYYIRGLRKVLNGSNSYTFKKKQLTLIK